MRRGFRPRTIAGGTARFEVRSLTLRAVPSKQSAKVRSPSRLRSARCISSIPFKTCNGPWPRESIRRCLCSSLRKLRSRISWRTSKRSSPCRHRVQRANKMAPTHPAGQHWPIIALGAFLSLASSPVLAQSPAAQRGLTFVRVHCAQCHAIDKVSDSPLTIAPPFRTLHLKFPIESLRRRLAEGIVADHPTMPQFRLDPDQIADVMTYLQTLKPSRQAGGILRQRPFASCLHLTENRLEFDLDQDRRLPSAQQCPMGGALRRASAWRQTQLMRNP